MTVKAFIIPFTVWAIGLIIVAVCAPMTTYVNTAVGIGFLLLCLGTYLLFFALYREFDRIQEPLPMGLDWIFPSYRVIPDETPLQKMLGGFRAVYSDFLNRPDVAENSSYQAYASQILWHSTLLQKLRMMKKGMIMQMQSKRRAYSDASHSVRSMLYFDGRYEVNDIAEEISSARYYFVGGKKIHQRFDNEIAHFSILSARHVGEGNVICPNCGASTTRENLIDGCDYCGTVFTVEDLQNRVGSFGFRRDFDTAQSKKDAIMKTVFPWIFVLVESPVIYFGIIGGFVYGTEDMNFFMRLIAGVLAAVLLGLLGWCMVGLCSWMIAILLKSVDVSWSNWNKNMLYRSDEELAKEREISNYVRRIDPQFSLQSFFGSVQNVLSAVLYADDPREVNAFARMDLRGLMQRYQNVVDMDMKSISMDSYRVQGDMQVADVTAKMVLHEWNGKKIGTRKETIHLVLIKSAKCKTQAVCGPSVMRCPGCGRSVTLMDGGYCRYCGGQIDLAQHDWVIAGLTIVK